MAEPSPPVPSKLLSATQRLKQKLNAALLEKLWEKFKDNLDELLDTEILQYWLSVVLIKSMKLYLENHDG